MNELALVVVVPTFQRPALLTKLLDGLMLQAVAASALVIVGDNDCDDSIRDLLNNRADAGSLNYLAVSSRGVAQVRNALVAEAGRLRPDWRWLLMLDDDGQVTPDWLERIVSTGDQFDADLVGGPVEGMLPESAGALARNSIFARRRRWPTGLVDLLNTTQNLAIGRRAIERVGLPLFDSRYGASGGEDYDLFRRMQRANGRIAWCDEAVVVEPAPPERLTTRALLHRYYSTGVYMGPIDRGYDGTGREVLGAAKGLIRGTGEVLVGALSGQRDMVARGMLASAHHVGRLSSLFGMRSTRYVPSENGQ